jgi:hypothetical protein
VAGGLDILFTQSLPSLGPRWLYFFLLLFALTGLALPVTAFLNLRFPSNPPANGNIVLRQALWFGVYGNLISWLQMDRELTLGLGIMIAGGMIVIEILIRLGERSRWSPGKER